MATYLLDTNIIIHVLRGQKGRAALLQRLLEADHLLASCPVTIAEVYARMNPREETATRLLMESLCFLDIRPEVAEAAGLLKRDWGKKGRTLTLADALLAAIAMANRCILLTENARDFPMPELLLNAL